MCQREIARGRSETAHARCAAGTTLIDKPDGACTMEIMLTTRLRSLIASCLALSATSACSKPLGVHADAGRADAPFNAAPDAVPDAVPDLPQDLPALAPDLAPHDLGVGGDERPRGGVPKGFRFDNQSDHTVYISRVLPVSCAQQSPAGLIDCNFFPFSCGMSCSAVTNPQSCCTLCIGFPSSLYVIAPGKSQFVAWSGSTHAKVISTCTDCGCNQESPASTGMVFQASIAVYTEYSCDSEPCVPSDAGVMDVTWPAGTPTTYTVNFAIPYLGDEIVFVIPAQLGTDAAVADATALDATSATDAL